MKDLAERIRKEVDQRLKEDFGKEEGLVSRQAKATIDVIADYLNAVFLVNGITKDVDNELLPWEIARLR